MPFKKLYSYKDLKSNKTNINLYVCIKPENIRVKVPLVQPPFLTRPQSG